MSMREWGLIHRMRDIWGARRLHHLALKRRYVWPTLAQAMQRSDDHVDVNPSVGLRI